MFLQLSNLSKHYGTRQVLTHIGLQCEKGTTLSILGTSGCGKTTLLKIIAGLEVASEGDVQLEGRILNVVPSNEREVIYLFQEALLFPHLTVFENIAFGLRVRKWQHERVKEAVLQMVADLGLEGEEQKMPNQLSGGQKQRVAFGRALIVQPKMLLLDEPFSSLDHQIKKNMQELFTSMTQKHGITSLFVTHDVREALVVGTQWAYLEAGILSHFASKEAFMTDARTGVAEEKGFWENLN